MGKCSKSKKAKPTKHPKFACDKCGIRVEESKAVCKPKKLAWKKPRKKKK